MIQSLMCLAIALEAPSPQAGGTHVPEAFESRMEYTDNGGRTWKPGNHRTFRRINPR